MKIKRVFANNRKRAFIVETRKGLFEFPYSMLTIKPSRKDPLISVQADPEIANEGFIYSLKSGQGDTVLLDQVLAVNQDPDYLRQQVLYDLACLAQDKLKNSGLSKRALARRLHTPPAQLYRLLDQSFYGKTIDQMIRLLHALGVSIKISEKAAA